MKKIALLVIAAAILLPAHDGGAGADVRTLTGDFTWNQGAEGELEAVFTANDAGTWDVDFHFSFQGRAHVYSGTAEGSLDDGPLEGKVRDDSRRRIFVFEGRFEDGVFRGEHAESRRNREARTGTLTLRGQARPAVL